jgi:hypothetical protein
VELLSGSHGQLAATVTAKGKHFTRLRDELAIFSGSTGHAMTEEGCAMAGYCTQLESRDIQVKGEQGFIKGFLVKGGGIICNA